MRKEKGITLIALVITIIVLLILAGVAIAMLSGENGILRKAAEAKTKTEEAQKQEEKTLTDMELATNFLTKKANYKCSYGYITGFNVDKSNSVTDTVEDLEKSLPDGYTVALKYEYNKTTMNGEDKIIGETEKYTKISTGMAIQKNGVTVARTVVFGDVNCDGEIMPIDRTMLSRDLHFIGDFKDFQRLASNLYDDNEINMKDILLYGSHFSTDADTHVEIDQNRNIKIEPKNIKRWDTKIQEYISLLNKDNGYEFVYNEESDNYKLKGVSKDKKAGELINELPDSSNLKILDESGKEVTEDAIVSNGYYIKWTIKNEDTSNWYLRFAYIETK